MNGALVITIDASSPLAAIGSAALVQGGLTAVLVAHTGQDSFAAFSATCTHQACTITGQGNQTFVCPCHGSQFSRSGQVVNGPASVPLRRFTTQFANNVLTVTT